MAQRDTSTIFFLIRHGQTGSTGKILPGRAPGLHLSDVGRAQADAVAQTMAGLTKKPTALYCSPLERTRETAAPVARALGLKAVIEKGLLECDFGTWTGRRLATLRTKPEWRAVQTAPSSFRFPDGESFTEMQLRMWHTMERLAKSHRGKRVVLVSHADPIKAAVTYAQGVPLDLFQRTVISTCSVSVVRVAHSGPIVLGVNVVSTLNELGLS